MPETIATGLQKNRTLALLLRPVITSEEKKQNALRTKSALEGAL